MEDDHSERAFRSVRGNQGRSTSTNIWTCQQVTGQHISKFLFSEVYYKFNVFFGGKLAANASISYNV
jgi:hypothetical protein